MDRLIQDTEELSHRVTQLQHKVERNDQDIDQQKHEIGSLLCLLFIAEPVRKNLICRQVAEEFRK